MRLLGAWRNEMAVYRWKKQADGNYADSAMITWRRADPVDLETFDEREKRCVMNCGPARGDPRSDKERKFLCDDCEKS